MKIIINAENHEIFDADLSYDKVVELADTKWGPKATHSVMYRHTVPFDQLPGERDGILSPGKSLKPSEGMIINAAVCGSA